MDLVLVTPPASGSFGILTLAQAKTHLGVDFTDHDGMIQDLIDAGVQMLDGPAGLLGRALLTQTWKLQFDYSFPSWRVALPLAPLQSVTSIKYYDANGVQQTLDSATYTVLNGEAAAVQPAYGQAWPAPRSQVRAIEIVFVAGYGAAADVPRPLQAAIKLLVGHLYEHREAVVGVNNRDSSSEIPLGVANLIAPFKARSVA